MNWIGAKTRLAGFLESVLAEFRDGSEATALDPFCGSGAAAALLKRNGLRVVAGDALKAACVLTRAAVEPDCRPEFAGVRQETRNSSRKLFCDAAQDAVEFLDRLPGKAGFVTCNWSDAAGRFFFTEANARRIDAIREKIAEWEAEERLTDLERDVLLACLLEAADSVANTAAVYDAHLKQAKPAALRPLKMGIGGIAPGARGCRVEHSEAETLAATVSCDVLYLDPPYVSRRYASVYHLPETLVRWDRFKPVGAAGLRPDRFRSEWESAAGAAASLERMLAGTEAGLVLLSYSDEGVMETERILEVMGRFGVVTQRTTAHPRFLADKPRRGRRTVVESVFVLDRRGWKGGKTLRQTLA